MNKNIALLFINLSVLTGFSGPLYKAIGFSVTVTAAGRAIFSALALIIFSVVLRRPLRVHSGREWCVFLLGGAIQAFHWLSTIASTKLSTVALGTILFSTFPLFIIFLEPLMFGTGFKVTNVFFALVIVAGVAVMMPSIDFKDRYVQGILAGLVSSLTYALLVLNNKRSSSRYECTTVVLYNHLFAAIFLTAAAFFSGEKPVLVAHDFLLTAVLGVVATAVSYTFFVASLKAVSAQVAGICAMFESVYGIILAFLFLNEIPSAREIAGGSLILAVVLLFQILESRK